MRDDVSILKRVALFSGVDDETLERLYSVGTLREMAPGDYVVRQGEFGDSFFVLLDGLATVEVVGEDGRSREVASIQPSQYFGELALVGRGERKASVRARTQAALLELGKGEFNQVIKRNKLVKGRIQEAYNKSALSTFVRQSRYFRGLPPERIDEIVLNSSLESFKKDDLIAREGDPAQKLFVVRSGFVRISRLVSRGADMESGEEILAYLGPEDFFGDEEVSVGAPYGATAMAVEPVECMVVPRSVVWNIYVKHPEVFSSFRRYSLARSQQQSGILQSQTSMGFVRDMLEAGLGQARSALIINLDTCIRCGNCVQACDDLHGYSRLARRGKKLTRRTEVASTRHESLYFPTSCLQCAAPECMVGCPTGAIARDVGGEVYIKDTCIGCGSCARNCDFGNISMAKAKEEDSWLVGLLGGGAKDEADNKKHVPADRAHTTIAEPAKASGLPKIAKSDLLAVKCDVCFEREFAACVYNCPTESILRIDPRNYFHELRRIAPKLAVNEQSPTAAKTTTSRRKSRVGVAILEILTFLVTIAGGYVLHGFLEPTPWRGVGMYAGVAAAAIMGVLSLMGLRKRMRTHGIGSLAAWVKVHAVLGGLLYGTVLFHAGYQATSVLTATLLTLLTISSLVAIGGQLASVFIPAILARSEDEALLPEDVGPKVRELAAASEEFLEGLDERTRKKVEQHAQRMTQGGFAYVLKGTSPKDLDGLLETRAKKLRALPDKEHAVAIRVAHNLAVARMHSVRRGLEILLTSWVPLHLVASALALMLLFGHILTVFLW